MAEDMHICSSSVFSHFIQIGGGKLIQVDLLPFLTPSQLEEGHELNWFAKDHLHETLVLLRPVLMSCLEARLDKDAKKSEQSQSCVVTGETVRVAYALKPHPERNRCLVTHFSSQKKTQNKASSSSKGQPSFEERSLHKEKVVAFVCPKTNSSLLQLSQLVHADVGKSTTPEISKYFLPSSAN
ncbi:unnamed protein product [Candidula unifasciata]|uniref:Uncharacterized protein n=1 Tax=Candidula unifasciata TaxID=100452 RepID=A0A8S3ZHM1_9EUPU|nr:unnamed protein product [Candidula unifasciata]